LSSSIASFVRLNVRSPLVDLRVRRRRRIDHSSRGARFVRDPHEVVEDRLGGQLLDDARSSSPAHQAGRDHRDVQPLEGTRDVDALAAGERETLARTVALAELEVRDGQRPVDRSVQSHRDDHENQPLT